MKNYVLHFIRHGRTEHQRQGVYMGRRTGFELSAEGIGELLALRREYDYPSAALFTDGGFSLPGEPADGGGRAGGDGLWRL